MVIWDTFDEIIFLEDIFRVFVVVEVIFVGPSYEQLSFIHLMPRHQTVDKQSLNTSRLWWLIYASLHMDIIDSGNVLVSSRNVIIIGVILISVPW